MPLTPHDEYYHKMRDKAHDKMARVTGHEADGDVDVDKLETFSKAAFASQPKVETPFAVTFEQADADAFLNRLRRG